MGKSVVQVSTPESLKWTHDPTVARGLFDKVGKLESEILIKFSDTCRCMSNAAPSAKVRRPPQR
jgi:hypothetical protein